VALMVGYPTLLIGTSSTRETRIALLTMRARSPNAERRVAGAAGEAASM